MIVLAEEDRREVAVADGREGARITDAVGGEYRAGMERWFELEVGVVRCWAWYLVRREADK
jgi:hypothetical protein